jgi:neutral ceramidase
VNRVASIAGLALLCVVWTACKTLTIAVPASSGNDPRDPGVFIAGADKVDITPIPGLPIGGHSLQGKASRGFWTRLYARALYLRDANGTPLVLVSADLGAIPGGLGDEVTRLLHEKYGLTWIGREHLLLSATHTHHGPGNFYTDKMWNDNISPWTGFDEALFHFLAGRIALAVERARDAAQPSRLLATDPDASQAQTSWKLKNFARNRSLPAFLLNPRAPQRLDADAAGCVLERDDSDTPWYEPDPRACTAIRPQVELLAIQHTGSSKFIGVAAFLAVHATVLPARLEVYSSDLFGVADARLEQQVRCDALKDGSVVAFFNGAEGDVSPTWRWRHRDEAQRLGKTLADKVCELLKLMDPETDAVNTAIDVHFDDGVELAGQTFTEKGAVLDADGGVADLDRSTTEKAMPGAAVAGGAEDGRSPLYKFLGHREGKTRVARREHGPKSPIGQIEALGIEANPLKSTLWNSPPPDVAPLAVYQIGATAPDVVIVAVPGELTTQMGRRVRRAVWNSLDPADRPKSAERILIAGLANEYIGYLTTPEEYDAQHYEGAMTLYGPASGPYLAHELAQLTQAGTGACSDPPCSRCYQPGGRKKYGPRYIWGASYLEDDGLADLLHDPVKNVPRRDHPIFCWRDALPRLEEVVPASSCDRSNPEVTVQMRTAADPAWKGVGGNAGVEAGVDLITAVTDVGKDDLGTYHTDWCAIWLGAPAFFEPTPTREFRFHVRPLVGSDRDSAVFHLVDVDPDGSGVEVPDGWLEARFLQQPAEPLEPDFPVVPLLGLPLDLPMAGQCTVPVAP